MGLANSTNAYGGVARFFHWAVALLIVAIIPLGIVANDLAHQIEANPARAESEEISRAVLLFSIHKTVGMVLFVLALARIIWAIVQPKPAPLHPERRLETFLAETVHWLLYGSLVLVPLTGWVSHAAQPGFAPIWGPFPEEAGFVPQTIAVKETAASLHIIFERVLVAAIALHVAGVLRHVFIDRDATFKRMWRGEPAPAQPAAGLARKAMMTPFVLAVALWATAIGAGSVLGLFQSDTAEVGAAVPIGGVSAASDAPVWRVQSATLEISVLKNNSAITGRFENFDTEIRFDPTSMRGAVDVVIDVASLDLGGDTRDALSPGFLGVASHPGARYFGAIGPNNAANGYVINGELRLKGITVDLPLHFELSIEDGVATANGHTTIDRRDFGVADNIDDADTLGFDVQVNVAITAHSQGET